MLQIEITGELEALKKRFEKSAARTGADKMGADKEAGYARAIANVIAAIDVGDFASARHGLTGLQASFRQQAEAFGEAAGKGLMARFGGARKAAREYDACARKTGGLIKAL